MYFNFIMIQFICKKTFLLLPSATYSNCATLNVQLNGEIQTRKSSLSLISRSALQPGTLIAFGLPHIANFLITLSTAKGQREGFAARMQPWNRPQTNTCNQRHLDKNKYKQIAAAFFCSPLSTSPSSSSFCPSAVSTSCTFLHKIPTILAANAKDPRLGNVHRKRGKQTRMRGEKRESKREGREGREKGRGVVILFIVISFRPQIKSYE